jgi:hypothetical protein
MHVFSRRGASFLGALTVASALIAPLAAAAQEDSPAASIAAEGVGVARISLIAGNVGVQRGDSADSLRAAPNAPVLGGDYVTTGDASQAEIQLDGYSSVRLDHDVQLRFTRLDPAARSVQIAAGTVELRLLHGTDGSTVIDTPSVTLKPRAGGAYRVTITSGGQTLVTVRSGKAEIDTPQGARILTPGMALIAQGDAAAPAVQTAPEPAFDDFDRFNAQRDRVDAPAIAQAGFVDPDIGGAADLDAYGRWVTDGSYGHVWVPAAVGPAWAPYRDGRWVWEEGYGWTWIAAEPWGWAPYHYGSWYHSPSYGWCWHPPQPRVYVPWRPALVAFIGFGAGAGFSLGFSGGGAFGQIGWVPLAPFEPYHPWGQNRFGYRAGPVVANDIGVTNVTNVTNVTVYRNVRYNAVSSVSAERFLQGNFTHNVAVSAPQLRRAQVFRGAIPVVPTASNLRFATSTAPPAVGVRPALLERTFAGNQSTAQRMPFATQRAALATATKAAITPLHFKDAQTTPLALDRAFARPAAANGRLDAWSRFNATRSPNTVPGHFSAPGAASFHGPVPATTDDRARSGATIDGALGASNQTGRPFTPSAYHAPRSAETYRAPHPAETYRAPHPAETYRAPHTAEMYHPPHAAVPHHAPHAAKTAQAPHK